MIDHYEDFELIFAKRGDQLYVDLGAAPGGRYLTRPIPVVLPDDRTDWIGARQGHKSEGELAELGHRLFQTLITGEIADNWYACLGEVRQRPGTGLRLRFSLPAEALTEAPLELLCARTAPTHAFLALDPLISIVRSPRYGVWAPGRPTVLPLRMLVIIATPALHMHIDPTAAQVRIETALDTLLQTDRLLIDYLGVTDHLSANYETLHHTLVNAEHSYDIVHFICHGAMPDPDDKEAEGILLFVDSHTGRGQAVRASDLAGILARNGVQVAVLEVPGGAQAGRYNAFQGVAQRLMAEGLMAVVAMQCPVGRDVAAWFCSQLYRFWPARGGIPIERAVTEARRSVRQRFRDRPTAWWTPVLFIRQKTTEVLKVGLVEQAEVGAHRMAGLPFEVKIKGISLFIDIGRWAASELRERWKLARQKKDAEQPTEVDLSKQEEEVKQQAEIILQDIATERGVAEIERVLNLIERKRNLIVEWKESKVDNEEAYSRQMITRTALRLRQQELDQKIADIMSEIETDLGELGVQVGKEEVEQRAN